MDELTATPAIRERLRALAGWLDATPVELLGLATLLAGAVLVTVLLWWQGQPRPTASSASGGGPDAAALTPAPDAADPPAPSAPTEVTVHVTGAVAAPGVVRLPAGARVADAVAAAGGASAAGDPGLLNLAREVVDGEQVAVPEIGEPVSSAPPGEPAAGPGGVDSGPLDLNQASTEQLEALPGIGPVLAARIVEWRDANGGFTEIGQLREVSGIGEKRFQELSDQVRV